MAQQHATQGKDEFRKVRMLTMDQLKAQVKQRVAITAGDMGIRRQRINDRINVGSMNAGITVATSPGHDTT
jgi:polysaccharide deacetylase 2 family uncharacterized protein YibQ